MYIVYKDEKGRPVTDNLDAFNAHYKELFRKVSR